MTETVLYERVGPVAKVTMNRPRYRNAQSRVLLEQLDAAFAEAVADHEVRVCVLFGAGERWSSGHDIGTPEEMADREARPYPPGVVGHHQRSSDWRVDDRVGHGPHCRRRRCPVHPRTVPIPVDPLRHRLPAGQRPPLGAGPARSGRGPGARLRFRGGAVNDAQDAMGFRAAMAAGHSSYMIANLGGAFFDEGNPFGSRKRMPGIDAARRSAEG